MGQGLHVNHSAIVEGKAKLRLAVLVVLSGSPVLADQTHNWIGGNSGWATTTNWNTAAVPGGAAWQVAAVTNGGTANVSTNVVPGENSNPAGEVNEIWAGNGAGTGTISVGEGGRIRSWQWLTVGRSIFSAAGNTGSRLLASGNASVEAWKLEIGQAFAGGAISHDAQAILSGNSVTTVYNTITLGLGEYNLAGASMTDGTLTVKDNAILNLTGFDATDAFSVGETGWGTGGTGNGNKGTLNVQDNAAVFSRGRLVVGHFEGGNGTVNLSGNATITIDPNVAGYGAVFMLGDYSPDINARSKGTFTQSGTSTFTLGNPSAAPFNAVIGNSGEGTYTLNGGQFYNWSTTGLGIGIANVNGNIGSGTLNLNGGTLTTSSIQGGVGTSTINFNGGKVQAISDNANFIAGITTANVQAGGALIDSNNVNIQVPQNFTGVGGLTKTGVGTLTLSGTLGYAGATTVDAGTLSTVTAIKNGAALNISNGALVDVPANGAAAGVTIVSSVNLTGTGSLLNLHNNDLIVDYGVAPSPYADILLKVKQGLTGLGGTGTDGITSSEVNAVAVPGTTLAVVEGAGSITTLSGQAVPHPLKSVLVKYTWVGDANLDGVVDGTDYALTDSGFAGGGTTWNQGDYNYSGVVDGTDYALIDTGFGSQSGTLPEPAMLSLLGLGASFVGMRRRRV